jgi:hypothetical protein
VYFNERFGVSAIKMRKLGVFNTEIGVDNKMFVDPKLLENATEEFAGAHDDLRAYFRKTVELLKLSQKKGDLYWKTACKRMQFKETSNTSLGFSEEGTDGNGIGKVLAAKIILRAHEILPHVNYSPDVFELIGVFAENLGCDRLSDMIVSILTKRFLAYTDRITKSLGVQQTYSLLVDGKFYVCPQFKKGEKPLLLVPRDLLKPLPIALDIEEALDNAAFNDDMREKSNKIFADSLKQRMRPGKSEMRALIRANPASYQGIIDGYRKAVPVPYDFDKDPSKVSDFDPIAREIVGADPTVKTGLTPTQRVEMCLSETIANVKHSIEENRLSDVLFSDDGKPRKEVISQRVIYAIARIFGRLYNVDVSREGNAGPGAIDFRFTVGHENRSLVEVKLSTHSRLVDGYYEQLPAYGKAEKIQRLVLLVIKVDADGDTLAKLKEAINKSPRAIDLYVLDAVRKPSASKRRS